MLTYSPARLRSRTRWWPTNPNPNPNPNPNLNPNPNPNQATVTDKMVADVVEALLGTIYLEAGWGAAQRFFDDFILRQVRSREQYGVRREHSWWCVARSE